MKRFALAVMVLVCCWLSTSVGQQIDPDRRHVQGVLIDDRPEEHADIKKHNAGDDFLSVLKVGEAADYFDGQILRFPDGLENAGRFKVSKITTSYVTLTGEDMELRLRTSAIVAIHTEFGTENPKPNMPKKVPLKKVPSTGPKPARPAERISP